MGAHALFMYMFLDFLNKKYLARIVFDIPSKLQIFLIGDFKSKIRHILFDTAYNMTLKSREEIESVEDILTDNSCRSAAAMAMR